MKIQVIFGSQSDERVYGPLCRSLESLGEVKMEVASAHRNPERVRELVTTSDADVFVTGAGLAAHLPGVVASLTKKPVFGVAVNGAFAGMDAFLSIAQMPKDIPVAGVMENQIEQIGAYLKRANKFDKGTLKISWNPYRSENEVLARTLQELREKSGLPVEWIEPSHPECQGEIVLAGEKPQGRGLCLYVCEKEKLQNPVMAAQFFSEAQGGGMWVGVNNSTNFLLQLKKMKEMN
ncbi:AIR carboxylase family protein [Bdellovibrio sp. NC01]|uniref:AIR carboxylase family protein n=1 Tax=Bdellovibrio sp. NC01 TaxID=2220073 RepID=UPI00115837EE|nr:AIR carboxylase family protein [Bdellovibrio sp. NC01]QDK38838.1 phosphoribosylaminoimidazole carboxylase [Bdellovibrio sp. NC01]